jgi:transposase
MKVYFNRSGRHMPGFLRQAQKEGVIGCIPKASSILNFFGAERSTGYLRRLINLSCLPLRAVEGTTFAVDSTTFRLSRYERWYDEKRQDAVEERALVKAHMICGVKTHVIAQVEVTGGYEADGPRFSALLYRASDNFRIKEVSADAAYLSHENCVAAEIVGAEPFLWIKDGVTGRRGGVLEDLYHKFCVSHKEFVKRYNLRNNAESTHSVLKRRFKGPLSFRTERAIQNEILSMVLVHNLCCIIQCMVELGIEPEFWSEAASA